jgi:hypothetical protein
VSEAKHEAHSDVLGISLSCLSGKSLPVASRRDKVNLGDVVARYADSKPSEVTSSPWIYAERKAGSYPPATERNGKWLVFVLVEEVDQAWSKIKEATEAGELGDSAKVATMWPRPHISDQGSRVICVYTYDWMDEADVRRVRQALRELGFTWKLAYKSDRDTLDGKYRHRGDTRISKYYE